MTEHKMLIIVPTRFRPQNVAKVVRAWEATGAFEDGAELLFAIDADDPAHYEYASTIMLHRTLGFPIKRSTSTRWKPMVHKLNGVASAYVDQPEHPRQTYFAIGFAGDDHLPRTDGWANEYLETLIEMGTGVVSCSDGYRTDDLPTQWAMTSDIVRALGRMVPANVEHLYCDDAVRDLARAVNRYVYRDSVLIEHMHPVAKKADRDGQYDRVNSRDQFARDRGEYLLWRDGASNRSLIRDAATIRTIIERN
jgi:hypothetical protein